MGQNLDRLYDFGDPCLGVLDFEAGEVVEKAIEIVEDFRREFDPCHAAG
jgi:hypothetical protein